MVLKKENSIYIASTTWGWTDDTLIAAIFGFLPPDKETRLITGSESGILWSKTKVDNDTYYSAIASSFRLHKINDDLDFTVTNYGDIIIYRTSGCSYTPQEVIDSYNRYISSGFFVRGEKKEDKKMKFKANNYIYIATNTGAWNDDRLIEALLGYMPADREHHNITPCGFLWSKNKLLKDNWFNVDDANERLHNLDRKLKFTVTGRGDIIIYKDIYDDVSKIFEVYNRIIKQEAEDNDKLRKHFVSMASDSNFSFNCQPILTMPRNLGRSAAVSMLNSVYGLNPSFQAGLLRWGDWDSGFKLYFGVERATGKQKTVCLWKDGEKTIIRGDKSVLCMPVQYAVAWCYVKRRFKTTSQFKKYVNNHSHIMDGITYFEGDARAKMAQASVNNRTKKYDIYDAAALAITAKHYGSVKTIMTYCDGWGE